jgi:hypothetical protein
MIGWVLFADAVAHLVKEHGITEGEAQIITAARHGAVFTQGRVYHGQGQPFVIAPAAWDGMDPYPALSMLCTPNPGSVVQEPFLTSSNVFRVEIDAISLEAWVAGEPRPAAPHIEQPVPDSLRDSPLAWLDYLSAASTDNGLTDHGNGKVQTSKNSGGRPPKADLDLVKVVLRAEVEKRGGWPTPDCAAGWRTPRDLDDFLIEFYQDKGWSLADETVGRHRRSIVKELEDEGVGQN